MPTACFRGWRVDSTVQNWSAHEATRVSSFKKHEWKSGTAFSLLFFLARTSYRRRSWCTHVQPSTKNTFRLSLYSCCVRNYLFPSSLGWWTTLLQSWQILPHLCKETSQKMHAGEVCKSSCRKGNNTDGDGCRMCQTVALATPLWLRQHGTLGVPRLPSIYGPFGCLFSSAGFMHNLTCWWISTHQNCSARLLPL